MIIWKIGFTLDFGIIFLIPRFSNLVVLKLLAGGLLPYSNIEIGKSNTQIIFENVRVFILK